MLNSNKVKMFAKQKKKSVKKFEKQKYYVYRSKRLYMGLQVALLMFEDQAMLLFD